jgi:hypothetical protein
MPALPNLAVVEAREEGGPRHASEDAIVAAMSEQLVLYAQQMNLPRTIINAMMVIPLDRVKLLSAHIRHQRAGCRRAGRAACSFPVSSTLTLLRVFYG